MADLPRELIGAWRRTELVVGGEPRDDADVLWLQGAEWYADVRIPRDDHGGPVEAFAGPATWAAPHFTWAHDLDWLGSFPTDVGHLEWDGDDVVETGTFVIDGDDRPYSERWVRGPAVGPRLVARSIEPAALVAVRVGVDAIVMASAGAGKTDSTDDAVPPTFAVRRDRWDEGGAHLVFERAADRPPLPPFPFERSWTVGDRLAFDGVDLEVIDVG